MFLGLRVVGDVDHTMGGPETLHFVWYTHEPALREGFGRRKLHAVAHSDHAVDTCSCVLMEVTMRSTASSMGTPFI